MNRAQLEHLIGAATTIADDTELVIVGSQAILGQFPHAPEELLVSMEADVYPRNHPDRADLIDGSIGELSPFHETFGYYAQGVGPGTAVLPAGWEDRLVPVESPRTRGGRGLCPEVHDLFVSKWVAGRDKDAEFCGALLRHGLVDAETLRRRLADTRLPDERLRPTLEARLTRWERESKDPR